MSTFLVSMTRTLYVNACELYVKRLDIAADVHELRRCGLRRYMRSRMTKMFKIALPDGSVKEMPEGSTPADVAAAIGPGLAKAALAARVDGEVRDIMRPFEGDASLALITVARRGRRARAGPARLSRTSSPRRCRTCSRARRSPSARRPTTASITISRRPPSAARSPRRICRRSRRRCGASSRADEPLVREVWTPRAGPRLLREAGRGVQGRMGDGAARGRDRSPCTARARRRRLDRPLPRAAPRLDRQARSRGVQADARVGRLLARRPQEPDAEPHLRHRAGSTRSSSTPISSGSRKRPSATIARSARRWTCSTSRPRRTAAVFWHPKGWIIWRQLEAYMRRRLDAAGYDEIKTPQLIDSQAVGAVGPLGQVSREHVRRARRGARRPRKASRSSSGDAELMALKPMNCPAHIQVFKQGITSYRELPLRLAEFGCCHRNEPHGALHGIMRVRQFTQDDAHIFCTRGPAGRRDQGASAPCSTAVYRDLGFADYQVKLATRPDQRIGTRRGMGPRRGRPRDARSRQTGARL